MLLDGAIQQIQQETLQQACNYVQYISALVFV